MDRAGWETSHPERSAERSQTESAQSRDQPFRTLVIA